MQLVCKLNSDFARFTTQVKPVLQQIRLHVGGKTCNLSFQLVLQQWRKTSCTFFVACFTEAVRTSAPTVPLTFIWHAYYINKS